VLTADTNVYLYVIDERDPGKQRIAREIALRLRAQAAPIGLQVIGEFYAAATKRLKRAPWEAAQGARNLSAGLPSFAPSRACVERALAEASAGRFSYWDALLLASADLAGCSTLLSEDMADGTRLGGIEVVHVFGPNGISDRAQAALASGGAPR
jgi:predicted nucleic acid-binding protein